MDILRDYQVEFIDNIYGALQEHRRVLAQLPTGAGKTVCFVKIIDDFVKQGKKILLLVHRRELIRQAEFKIFKKGINYGHIMAGVDAYYSRPVQLASIQTLIRRNMPKGIDLVITDEAHHSTASSYKTIYEEYPNAQLLGFTATPCRRNGSGFEDIFDVLVTGPSMSTLIDRGHLVAPKVYSVPLREDLSKLRKTGGDYNERDIEQIMDKDALNGDIVETYQKHGKGGKAIVFASSIKHSLNIIERFKSQGITAVHIDGKMDVEERDRAIKKFERGDYTVLSNVGIATEGTDIPNIEVVILARPTTSTSLYLQMVGRGLRPTADKDSCIILDHANNVFNHGFPQADRTWSLHGIKSRKNAQLKDGDIIVKARAKDGRLFDPKDIPVEITDVELIELVYRAADERRTFLIAELKRCKQMGLAPLNAFSSMIRKYGTPTVDDIHFMQQRAGYKKGWVNHQLVNYGYAEPVVQSVVNKELTSTRKWTF